MADVNGEVPGNVTGIYRMPWYQTGPHASPDSKACDLLVRLLRPEERKEFEEFGHITIEGKRAKYVLRGGTTVSILQEGQHVGDGCLMLGATAPFDGQDYPSFDHMLANYLVLRNNEDFYWSTARISQVGGFRAAIHWNYEAPRVDIFGQP